MTDISIARDDSRETAAAISEGLMAFNRAKAGISDPKPLNVALRDAEGRIRGGVVARLSFDTVYIDTVWIGESLRGGGHGSAMMRMVEDEARMRGARQAWLYTLSWQARPFYEKLGYQVFGEIPFHKDDHKRFFMWKAL